MQQEEHTLAVAARDPRISAVTYGALLPFKAAVNQTVTTNSLLWYTVAELSYPITDPYELTLIYLGC